MGQGSWGKGLVARGLHHADESTAPDRTEERRKFGFQRGIELAAHRLSPCSGRGATELSFPVSIQAVLSARGGGHGRRSDGAPKRWGASPRRRNVPRAEPLSEGESTARGDAVALAGALGGPAQRPCSASCPWREGPRGGDVQVRSGADGRTGRAGARRGAGFLPALTGDGPLVRWSSGRRSRSASRFIRNQAPISSTPPTPIVNSPRDR